MKDELEIVTNELLASIEQLVYEKLKIERQLFLECGASAFESLYARSLPDHDINREDIFEQAESRFERLQQTAPHLISQVLRNISISYGIATNLINKNFEDDKLLNHMRALMEASKYFWQAIPMLEVSALSSLVLDAVGSQKSEQLSVAGANGATKRHALSNELRLWAIAQENVDLKNCSESARKLERILPQKFVNLFEVPGNIIASALREKKKGEKQKLFLNSSDT